MRVIYFGHYWRNWGGTEDDIRTMLRCLAKRGYECFSIGYDLSSSPTTALRETEEAGVRVFFSDYENLNMLNIAVTPTTPKEIYKQNALKYLRNYLEKDSILITCFSPEKEAWELGRKVGAKMIQKYTIVAGKWLDDQWDVDHHVFNSRCCKDGFAKIANIKGPSTIIFPEIDLPVDVDDYTLDGAIGMINPAPHKGLKVFREMIKLFPEERFISAGGWALDKFGLMGSIPNHEYIGHLENMGEFYKQLKILLVPTTSAHCETFGRIVMEGMKFGIPVMASNKDGIPEAAAGAASLIDDYESPDSWFFALRIILREKNLLKLHRKSIERANAYKINDIIDQWEEIFEKLAGDSDD